MQQQLLTVDDVHGDLIGWGVARVAAVDARVRHGRLGQQHATDDEARIVYRQVRRGVDILEHLPREEKVTLPYTIATI